MNKLLPYFAKLLVVLTALPVHEYAHAYAAHKLGDDTAKHQGRLTLNPLAHLDPIGTLMILLFGVGYAKPVPVNPYNFDKINVKAGMAITSFAGPLSNILMATLLLIIYKIIANITMLVQPQLFFEQILVLLQILGVMIMTNISLAIFNLLPIRPLDGSKIFAFFIPDKYLVKMSYYGNYMYIALFVVLFTGIFDGPLSFLTNLIYNLIDNITLFIDIIFNIL